MWCMLRIAVQPFCLRPQHAHASWLSRRRGRSRTYDGKCQRQPAPEQVDGVRRIGRAGVRDDQRARRAGRAMLAPEAGQPVSLFRVCSLLQAQQAGRKQLHCVLSALTQHALCMVWTYVA